MKTKWIKPFIKWSFLALFLTFGTVIMVESGIDGTNSGKQSDAVTDQVQDIIDKNYDKDALREIKDFDIDFARPIEGETFYVGDSLSYSISFSPLDTTYKTLDFEVLNNETSDQDVLEIREEKQEILFKKRGIATLSVKSQRNPSLKKLFKFQVENVLATSLELQDENGNELKKLSLGTGDSQTIFTSILPESTTDKSVHFESDKPEILEVGEYTGVVKALQKGTGTITATMVDNPSVWKALPFEVKLQEITDHPVTSLQIKSDLGFFNENVKEIRVQGTYTDIVSPFDPSKINVAFSNGGENYIDVLDKKRTDFGSFSFLLRLKDNALTKFEKEGIEKTEFGILVSYGQEEDSPTCSSKVNLQKTKTISIEDIDENKVPSSLDKQYIHLEKLGKIQKEPIQISFPLKNGLIANECNKKNFKYEYFKLDGESYPIDTYFSRSEAFSSLTLTPKANASLPLDGKVIFYPNKTEEEFVEVSFHYSEMTDKVSTIDAFSFKKILDDSVFLVNEEYNDKELFATSIEVTSSNAKVKRSLETTTPINVEIKEGADLVSLKKSGSKIVSLTFLKEGSITLELKCALLDTPMLYHLSATNEPNLFETYVDGKLFEGDLLTIGKNEKKAIEIKSYRQTSLKDGSLLKKEVSTSFDWSFSEGYQNSIVPNIDSETAIHTLTGIKQNSGEEPINITFNVLFEGKKVASIHLAVKVTYVAVDKALFSFSLSVYKNPNEYNIGKEDGSLVSVGSVLHASVTMNEDATNQKVSYSSSDTNVLKVDPNTGVVTAIKSGEASIIATSRDDVNITFKRTIKVVDTVSPFVLDTEKMQASSLSIEKDQDGNILSYSMSLEYGSSYQIFIKAITESTSSSISFSLLPKSDSSQKHAISIDKSGRITTIGIGEDTVLVRYGEGLSEYTQKVTFKVDRNYHFTWSQLALIVRKTLGHFSLFAVTALFSVGFILMAFHKEIHQVLALLISEVAGFALASFSELLQLYTPGRSGRWEDVGIDTAGYSLTIVITLLAILVVWIIRLAKKKKMITMEEQKEDELH